MSLRIDRSSVEYLLGLMPEKKGSQQKFEDYRPYCTVQKCQVVKNDCGREITRGIDKRGKSISENSCNVKTDMTLSFHLRRFSEPIRMLTFT